jgi:hypothetical protein
MIIGPAIDDDHILSLTIDQDHGHAGCRLRKAHNGARVDPKTRPEGQGHVTGKVLSNSRDHRG